jgi:hypothetical protein
LLAASEAYDTIAELIAADVAADVRRRTVQIQETTLRLLTAAAPVLLLALSPPAAKPFPAQADCG